jgi:ribosome recycling factor
MSIDSVLNTAQDRMTKSMGALQAELAKLRTGRAHPGLIENVLVSSYGSDSPLKQIASIVAEDAQTLVVNVWDKSQLAAVEKAIVVADLGLNPVVNGTILRIPLPPLTQERRDHFAKLVRGIGENSKISIRNIRRDLLNEFKQFKKDKLISEDEERSGQARVQTLTDDFVKKIEQAISAKEIELKTI